MKKEKNIKNKILNYAIWAVLIIVFLGIATFFYFIKDLPRPEVFTESQINQTTKIYDKTGEILLTSIYGEENRTYVSIDDIPEIVQYAVISTEDAKFYQHNGIDFQGIVRIIKLALFESTIQGASTITQQLIRSTFLTQERTIERKLKEIVLSLELDRRYDKKQILEWYLNQVPFGINIYGVKEACQIYFQKDLNDVSLEEAAVLAAIIQLPSYYSPYGDHLEELLNRKDYVLRRMYEENYISEDQYLSTKEKEITFNQKPQTLAPQFVSYVEKQLEEIYGKEFLEIKGLKIYTTLDWDLQQKAEEIVKAQVEKNIVNYGAYNAALVAIEPSTGEILTLIGSADPWGEAYPEGCDPAVDCKFAPSFDVATMGNRQPGSSFKPIVYAKAFQNGYTDKTIVIDELTDFGVYGGEHYIPKNYDGLFRGPITLRNALAQSLNIPAVKTLRDLAGLEESIDLATKMGITTLTRGTSFYGLSLVLGGGEVHLLDLTSAYSVFANGGYRIPPTSILKIEDANGNVIYENTKTPRKVLEKEVCDLIMDILSDNEARTPMFGANSILRFDTPQVAVKTGTTQLFIDGWTMGTSNKISVGVWTGNNDNSSMAYNAIGLSTAGPIWRQFMEYALGKI